MKRLLLLLIVGFSINTSQGQDIPLFSQKLTNSFIYNPAMAGHTFGSMTASYRSNYSGVQDAPKNIFLSLHTPLAGNRFGTGFNIYQENVSFMKNTYYSGAFAYHLNFNKLNSLSMGASAEFNQFNANGFNSVTDPYIPSDPTFQRYQSNSGKLDFSFGMMYQNQFLKIGVSANRLATAWLSPDDKKTLSNYFTSFVQGMIPLRDGQDLIEPYFAYRKFSETNNTLDVGLYYTYDNKITAGAATRSGNVLNFTLAYRLNKYLLVGYSNEMISNPVGSAVGTSNEFTLRYDFNDQSYQKKFRKDYKQSIAYRRKTLNTATIRKTPGGHTPKQLAKAQKRVAAFSPNTRYQNTKKLSMGKKSSHGKKSFNKGKGKKKSSPKKRKKR